ncbi:MAG: hypothetical protein COY81_02235 [Candidatus Pacebacteria bacterium CG_4_10_14_0_8_um_filter_43_12]|nr:MAG: hypothetical protein COY81_02235 [Candidatus Pacebacteria bacterium CG_4_10_14_0_8_um_filter_43_12]
MEIKTILLTGDDGYNSIGTRLLVKALKNDFLLQIAATKYQQSGVGGGLSLQKGGNWGETTVDGVPALWVEGSPGDTMECTQALFKKPFDLIISGVNLGCNASSAVISSGTFGAAVRGIGVGVAPRGLVMSWDAPVELYHKQNNGVDSLSDYLEYPGAVLLPLVKAIIAEKLWGVDLLNINFPRLASKKVRFTKITKDITKQFSHPIGVDKKTHRFTYDGAIIDILEKNPRYDIAAIDQGFISITPCAYDMTHFTTFERLEKSELEL